MRLEKYLEYESRMLMGLIKSLRHK
jgi:hypothetical protein